MHIQYVTSVKGRELQIGYICYSVISHFYSSNHIIMEDVKAFIGHKLLNSNVCPSILQ